MHETILRLNLIWFWIITFPHGICRFSKVIGFVLAGSDILYNTYEWIRYGESSRIITSLPIGERDFRWLQQDQSFWLGSCNLQTNDPASIQKKQYKHTHIHIHIDKHIKVIIQHMNLSITPHDTCMYLDTLTKRRFKE